MYSTKQRLVLLLVTAISFQLLSCTPKEKRPVDYVDPFICTQDDHGQWHPSALVPFGMVKLGPDTYPGSLKADGDFAHSGYNFSDDMFRGFSHSHKGSSGGGRIIDRSGRLSIFPELTIHHDSETKFKIIANNVSEDNFYIQSAMLNGQPYNKPWIDYSAIINGGTLVFEMGPEPNKQWGTGNN